MEEDEIMDEEQVSKYGGKEKDDGSSSVTDYDDNDNNNNNKEDDYCSSDEQEGLLRHQHIAGTKQRKTKESLNMATVDDGIVAENTGKAYMGEIISFFNWCMMNEANGWLSEYGKAALSSLQVRGERESHRLHKYRIRHTMKSLLRECSTHPMINIDAVTPRGFMEYLLTLRHSSTGGYLSKSSYGNKRAALFHLFRLHNGMGYRDGFRLELANLFKGFYRNIVKIRHEEELHQNKGGQYNEEMVAVVRQHRKEGGKEPMSVELYRCICGWLLEYGTIDGVWAHLFLVFSWNLGCRSNNTAMIKMSDLSWATSFDSFEICFAHSKTDQVGEDSQYPRHIYANPQSPVVCPVLALALYFCCCFNIEQMGSSKLFPGPRQCTRFSNILSRVLQDHEEKVNKLGYQLDDIGTHSIRKGAFSYLASLNGGPPSAAICIRGGWTMGKVRDVYMRYVSSGDEFVGRCLALLQLMSTEFASSPPFFSYDSGSDTEKWVEHHCGAEFPMLKAISGFGRLRQMAFASLLYHRKWILSTLAHNHVVLVTSVCLRSTEVDCMLASPSFADLVQVTYPWSDRDHVFAGIPPSVSLLQQLTVLQSGQMTLLDGFVDKVKEALSQFGVNADRLTPQEFRMILDNFKREMQGQLMVNQSQVEGEGVLGGGHHSSEKERIEHDDGRDYKMHHYGGKMHRVPIDWRFPRCGVHDLWRQWWIGDTVRQVYPLRFVETIDVKHLDDVNLSCHEMHGRSGRCMGQRRKAKKTLCDLKYIINWIIQKVKEVGAMEKVITLSAVDRMYFAVADLLFSGDQSESRDAQKHWPTFVRIARKKDAEQRRRRMET